VPFLVAYIAQNALRKKRNFLARSNIENFTLTVGVPAIAFQSSQDQEPRI
jgi:hypothetical protein